VTANIVARGSRYLHTDILAQLTNKIMVMKSIGEHWRRFNESSNALTAVLGRTANIVGEYAEYLSCKYYKGELLGISSCSADLKCAAGNLYQVKARKLESLRTTQLGVIRSWAFDYLVVIFFNKNGEILKGLEIPVKVAEKYGVYSGHQNGWIITTSKRFLNDAEAKDITASLSEINN
jgi:hypothetical protein